MIFSALDYNFNDSSVIENDGFSNSNRLEQFYIYFIDLFNLKTNTMKKISILTIMLTAIILGLFTVFTNGNAQNDITKPAVNKGSLEQLKDRELTFSDFTCHGCFEENGFLIGRDIKFKLAGVVVNTRLIMLNTKTREFTAIFTKGIFYENKVEVTITRDELVDNLFMYTADNMDKSKDRIALKGHARINSNKEDYIEADEIILNLK
jgi:hypothetical protein